jgi:hypothetical protein
MKASEIMVLVNDIDQRWPHSGVVEKAYAKLGVLSFEQAQSVVETLDADGLRFAPSAGQILDKFAQLLLDAPRWSAVLAEARRRQGSGGSAARLADRRCPAGVCNGSGWVELDAQDEPIPLEEEDGQLVPSPDAPRPVRQRACECRESLLAEARAAQTVSPVVAAFLAEVSPRKLHDALAGDYTATAQLKADYQDFLRDLTRTVAYAGIDTAGLPALERLEAQRQTGGVLMPGSDHQGLRRLSASEALGLEEPSHQEEEEAA